MNRVEIAIGAAIAVVAAAAIGIGVAYGPQISTAASLERMTSYEDGYNLYRIDVSYNYDLDAIIDADVRDDQAYIDAVLAQALPNIPLEVKAPKFACSAFRTQTTSGNVLMGRNYDFKDDTSALLVHTKPENGYESIAFSALNNLGANDADGNIKGRIASLLGPFASLDGINERGVSIAVLTLDSEATEQDTSRPAINTSLAIRLVLDRAATTQQAVDLLESYDMHAMAGRDYHFFISDATGDSRVVEYDPKDEERRLVATPAREVTNYYALYADEVSPNQKNGVLGHGKERADAIAQVLDESAGAVTVNTAWEALRAAAQDPDPNDVTSNTQWSIVFDNTNLTADIVVRRNWNNALSFALGE